MKYYIIGTRKREGATSESQITHYKYITRKGSKIDRTVTKQEFIDMLKPGDELFGFNQKTGSVWPLRIAHES